MHWTEGPEHPPTYIKSIEGRCAQAHSAMKTKWGLTGADNTLTPDEWRCILKRNKNRCFYCKKKFPPLKLTFDHVTPLSKGGRHVKENLVPACLYCNTSKSAKTLFLV